MRSLPLLLLLSVGLISTSVFAPAAEALVVPGATSGLPIDKAVVWGRLKNGIRYALLANDQPKEKVSLRLLVTSGSMLEDDIQLGLAHYLEHLAFNGTTHYPPGTMITELQSLGLSFGADTNAHTSFDETVYKLDLPDGKAATIATGLRVLGDFAGGMLLMPQEVDKERGIIMAEMRDRNTAGLREALVLYRAMYPGKRIAQRFPIGVPETVNAAESKHLKQFYNDWYRPERFVVVAVGALTADAVEVQIREAFGSLTNENPVRPEPDQGKLTPAELTICTHHEAEAQGTSVSIMRLSQRERPKDGETFRTQDLLSDMADGILSLRLSKYIAAHPGAALLDAGVQTYQFLDIFHAAAQAKSRPGQSLAALAVIEQEVRRMREFGPTPGEVASAVATYSSQLDEAVARVASRTNASLANAIYQAVKFDHAFMNPEQQRDLLKPILAKATPASVLSAFRVGWDSGNMFVSVTGADDLGGDAERQVRAAFKASQSVEVTAPTQVAVATWAYGTRPTMEPLSATAEAERKRKAEVFAKLGIHLDAVGPIDVVVKRTTFKPNEVLIQARLGMSMDPRPAGWSGLVQRAFLAGGLGKHPAEDLAEVLAGSSARFSLAGFDENAVVFNGSCLPKDLETLIQFMVAQWTDPGWRSDAETREKSEWRDQLQAAATNLDAQVSKRFQSLVVHDVPHRRAETLAEVEASTFAVVRPWFDQILATAPMQITVVGDIDEDAVITLLRPYLATLGTKRRPLVTHLGSAADLTLTANQAMPSGVHRFSVPGTVRRAIIRIAWPTTDFGDVTRTRRLGLLSQVIGERMRVRIREELGDAYSPSAQHVASEAYANFGYLVAQVGVAPEKADEARAAMLEIAKDLATKGVDAEVLERVRAPLVKSIAVRRQQNQYWLSSVLDRAASQPFRVEWATTLESDFNNVTAADLSALAKQYLNNEIALQIIGVCDGK
jgi:zinc protease